MKSTLFEDILSKVTELTKHPYTLFKLSEELWSGRDYKNDINDFIDGLIDAAHRIQLTMLKESVEVDGFATIIKEAQDPILVFKIQKEEIIPVVIARDEDGVLFCHMFNAEGYIGVFDELPDTELLVRNSDGEIIYLLPFPIDSLVSDHEGGGESTGELTPMQRMFRLLQLEKNEIFYVYFYAIIVAIIGLSLPLGIQAIMELVSGGVIFSSIVLLIAFVIVGIVASGGLRILQYTIVESIQRRIFVKAAFEFGYRIPRMRSESVLNQFTPELMNRFFDVLTIQKSLPKFIIDLAGSALQILFGIILLSFYHPFFVIFGVVLIVTLAGVLYYTGPEGLRTSIIESKYKYKVAHWLEELARTLDVFKMAGHTSLPITKTEKLTNNYLLYRKKHFKVLMTQFAHIIAFKTLVTGGLLIIGISLVINRQITLGQFVASEIVIILLLDAVEKVILSMSTIYDMLTAVDKLGVVTDLPLERNGGFPLPKKAQSGAHILVKNLSYKYPGDSNAVLKNVSLEIQPGESLCLSGFNSSGKNTLVKVIIGTLEQYEGMVSINGMSLRDINLTNLRDVIASNFAIEDIFEGTLIENITMGKPNVTVSDAIWALESVGLGEWMHALPKGLQTEIVAGGKSFSGSVHAKINLARCIAERPQLLILNDFLHVLPRDERLRTLGFLLDKKHGWSVMIVTNDPVQMAACGRVVIMKDGQISTDTTYEELIHHPELRSLVVQ